MFQRSGLTAAALAFSAVACVTAHDEAPPIGLNAQPIQTTVTAGTGATYLTDGVYLGLIQPFINSKVFIKRCGTSGATNQSPCLASNPDNAGGTATVVDGSLNKPGCWIKNTCSSGVASDIDPSVTLNALYRRPRFASHLIFGPFHPGVAAREDEILSEAVAFVTGLVRKNAFACADGSKSPGCAPAYSFDDDAAIYHQAALGAFLNYQIRRYYEPSMDRFLIAIEPRGRKLDGTPATDWQHAEKPNADGVNWGIFLFNEHPRSMTIVEVPHPVFDLNAERFGAEAFEKGDALALFVAGSHRLAIDDTDKHDPYNMLGKADAAHQDLFDNQMRDFTAFNTDGSDNRINAFEAAHQGALTGLGLDRVSGKIFDGIYTVGHLSTAIVQFHGFNADNPDTGKYGGCGYNAVVSQGYDASGGPTATSGLAQAVVDRLNATTYAQGSLRDTKLFPNAGTLPAFGKTLAGATLPLDGLTSDHDCSTPGIGGGGVEGNTNVQGVFAGANGVPFVHVEFDGTARMIGPDPSDSTKKVSLIDDDCARAQGPDAKQDAMAGCNTASGTRVSPNIPHQSAQAVLYGIDDWMATAERGILPSGLRTATICSSSPALGFDNDQYPDVDHDTDPYSTNQVNFEAYQVSKTMLAVRHTTDLSFAMYHLESPYLTASSYGKGYSSSSLSYWSGHRDWLAHAGWQLFPIYFAPVTDDLDFPTPAGGLYDGATDATDAIAKADHEGFGQGTAIYMDLETANRFAKTSNTAVYLKKWFKTFAAQSKYTAGIYCDIDNCDWVRQVAIDDSVVGPLGMPEGSIRYWGHSWECGSRTIYPATDANGTSSPTSVTFPLGVGCTAPQRASYPTSGAWQTALHPYIPSVAMPSTTLNYAAWQYAATNPFSYSDGSSTDGKPARSCFTVDGDAPSSNHGYNRGFLGPADDDYGLNYFDTTGPGQFECRLPLAGTVSKFTNPVDLDSFDTGCTTGGTMKFVIPDPSPREVWNPVVLGTAASALYSYVTNPNGTPTAAASALGVEPGIVTNWKSIYLGGGAKFDGRTLVANTSWSSAPTRPNPIGNGDFEIESLTNWSSTGQTSVTPYQTSWGGYAIGQVGQTTSATLDSSLAQTFTVPSNYTTLSFYYQVKCSDSITYDQFRVKLHDNTNSTDTTLIADVCSNDSTWRHFQYAIGSLVGHSLTVSFQTHDDGVGNYPTYAWVDNLELSTIANGAFQESSALAGWTSTGITAAYQQPGGSDPALGTMGAQVGSSSPYTDSSFSQTFVVPSWGASTLKIARKIVCLDSVTYAWAKITVTDTTTGANTVILGNTCSNTGAWDTTSYDVSASAGHAITLRFDVHDDNYPGDPIYMVVDRIRFE